MSRVVTLTVVDQGASSISNFGLSLLVAHQSGARELGVFAIVITTYILCQGLVRSVTSDCLLTRSGAESELRARFERSGYLFAAVAAGALSLVVLGVAAVVGSAFAIPFVIFAISFPLMALQDFSRYIGISRHEPTYAIRLDVGWILLFVVAVIGFRSAGLDSLPWLFGAWTGAGAVVGLSTLPAFFSLRRGMHELRFWLRSEWSVGTRFAGQFLVGTYGAYGVFYLLVFVLSIDAIGLIKVTQLALAPVVVLFAGVQASLVSIVSRKMRENRHRATRFLNLSAALMTLSMVVWTVLVYAVPVNAMADLLGPTWVQARPFMLWIGFATALGLISVANLIGLRAMRSAKELLRLVLVMTPFLVVLPLGGAWVGGIRGFAVGSASFSAIYAVISRTTFARATKGFRPEEVAEPQAPADMVGGDVGVEPMELSDVLAREGLVEPVSLADMFVRHRDHERVASAGSTLGDNGVEPITFAELLARDNAAGVPVTSADTMPAERGVEPMTFAELVARQGGVEPITFEEMLKRQGGVEPVTLADMLASERQPGASTDGDPWTGS